MNKKKVCILFCIIILFVGVMLVFNSTINKESCTIYRTVRSFQEKSVKNAHDYNKLKAIFKEIDNEIEQKEMLMGFVYLVRYENRKSKKEYYFYSNKIHYVEEKSEEVLVNKWYKIDDNTFQQFEDLFINSLIMLYIKLYYYFKECEYLDIYDSQL